MAVDAPITDDFDPDYAIPDQPIAGKYHCVIVRIDEDGGNKGEMVVDYEVLAGTAVGQEGKIFRDYFQKTMKSMGRMHNFAMACGMITGEQIKDMKARGQQPRYEFAQEAIDAHVCLDLYAEEYPEKSGKWKTKCGFGIFSVLDPKAKDIPKNMKMLADAGITLPPECMPGAKPLTSAQRAQSASRPAGGGGTTSASQQQPASAAAATVPFDVGDDLLAGVV